MGSACVGAPPICRGTPAGSSPRRGLAAPRPRRHFAGRPLLRASHPIRTEAPLAEDLRYPVGRFDVRAPVPPDDLPRWIAEIAEAPARLAEAVAGLSPEQLDTPYRPGGWTVRQVVHHVPDSHMNAYVRLKLALTEDEPTIKPYEEARWAELEDSRATPVEVSLALLDALHHRWVRVLRSLGPDEFARTLRHPEMGVMRVDALVGLYAWHGRHHVAHVVGLRERMGWR